MDQSAEALRGEAVYYIQLWIKTPYKYGGDDFSGLDCSGVVVETLQSVGRISPFKDYSSHSLYLKFNNCKPKYGLPYAGCLVFWFKEGKAYHVAMLINNFQVVEAAGGGKKTETREDAIRDNAYVRRRRVNYRGDNFKIVDPFKDWNPEDPV